MNKKGMNIRLIAVVLVVIIVIIAITAGWYLFKPQPGPRGTIKVGIPAPISGWFASSAEEAIRGVTMAVEDLNAQGGLVGYRLEIITADGGTPGGPYTPESTRTAMTYLASQGVDVMITCYLNAPIDVQVAAELGIPYLHVDTYHGVTELVASDPQKYWMAFQCDPNEQKYGNAITSIVETLTKKGLWTPINKKVAFLTIDIGYNQEIRRVTKQMFEEMGWTISLDEVFTSATVEWGVLLSKIRADPPALIVFNDHIMADEATFIKQFAMNPTNSLIYMQYGPAEPEFLELAGDAGNDVLWSTVIGIIPNQKGLEWIEKYRKRWGTEPGFGNAPIAYDCTMIWAEAVKKVGDPKKYKEICAEILKTDYQGLCGRYKFDPTTHDALWGEDYIPSLVFQIQNKEHVLIIPAKFATGSFKTPYWFK